MEKEKPFFSIITPFYNSERFINNYFEKLYLQTFNNWECILIDDYSEDRSFDLIQRLSKKDKRIKIFKNKLNKKIKGPYQARNFGLSLAEGAFICFLDIDDYWMDNMLAIKYKVLKENKNIDLIFTNYLKKNKNIEKKVSPIKIIPIKSQLNIHNPFGMLTTTVRRKLIINKKFRSIIHEDYVFWAELIRENPNIKIKHLNKFLATYFISDNSISSNKLLTFKWHYDCYIQLGYNKLIAIICFIPLLSIKFIIWLKANSTKRSI